MCAHVGKKANTDEGLYLKMSMDGWRYVNEEREVKALSIRQGNVHVCVCVYGIITLLQHKDDQMLEKNCH